MNNITVMNPVKLYSLKTEDGQDLEGWAVVCLSLV